MDIRLINTLSPHSSVGILSKAKYHINGVECYVKGNSINKKKVIGYEPYSEVMVSIIAEVLGFEHVHYDLMDAKLFPDIQTFGNIKHVSVCPDYKYMGYRKISSFYKYMVSSYGYDPDNHYIAFKELFPKEMDLLYKMLLLDAFVGNEDRHVRNIDIVNKSNNDIGIAPIFDNGASLLALRTDKEIAKSHVEFKIDKSKPFRMLHKQQIKLIDRPIISKVELGKIYNYIINRITPILLQLPKHRAEAIIHFLKWRIVYLKAGMEV